MPDFPSWKHENLVKFAEDADAEMNRLLAASIANANETARVLGVLRGLDEVFGAPAFEVGHIRMLQTILRCHESPRPET